MYRFPLIIFSIYIGLTFSIFAADYADEKQFGNKTANLAKIQNDIKKLQEQNIPVKIPAFFGIADDEVKDFLLSKQLLEPLNSLWKQFVLAQEQYEDLTLQGKKALEEIRTIIAKAFLDKDFFFKEEKRQIEFKEFIKELNDHFLMVRSTGREDTKEVANAGGNESIANVIPRLADISEAMVQVLQSYFSEKSYKQRIAGGESKESLFASPFMPVLLQMMIKETENEVPTSGVAFSREPFANAKHIVAINSIWGHGEAVVNGIYPCDNFFVASNDVIYPVLRFKHTRLIPNPLGMGLIPAKNNTKLVNNSSLNKKDILDIKNIALGLEDSRNDAVDIEFAKLNQVIYVLQVRPIVEATNKPSYLKETFIKNISPENKIDIQPIVSGGGELKYISNTDEIIIAEQIKTALDAYLDMNGADRKKVKLIVIGQDAPFNSHEATTFRANNKPVMFVRDFIVAQTLIKSGADIVADVQRGILMSVEKFDENSDVEQGWFRYPMPKQMSIYPEFFLVDQRSKAFNHTEFLKDNLASLLGTIANGDYGVGSALETLRFRVKSLVEAALEKRPNDKILNVQLRKLLQQFLSQSMYVAKSLDQDQLHRLFLYNFLEAILSQTSQGAEVILPLSILANIKQHIHEKSLSEELKTQSEYTAQYAKLQKYALNDEVKNDFQEFLNGWSEVSSELNQKFIKIIRDLVHFEIIPLWININFIQEYRKFKNTNKTVEQLVKLHKENTKTLDTIKSFRETLETFPWANFSHPKRFESTLSNFLDQAAEPISLFIVQGFEHFSSLEKLASLSLLSTLINHFDQAIKDVSRSNNYPSAIDKAKHFYEFLKAYFILFGYLINDFFTEAERNNMHVLMENSGEHNYVAKIHKKLVDINKAFQSSELNAIEQFSPSKLFNVSVAKLRSKSSTDKDDLQYISTLEDVFTLIHQDLLFMVGNKISSIFSKNFPLPDLVKKLSEGLRNLKISLYDVVELSEIAVDNNSLRLIINQPLGVHSATYIIGFNFNNRKTTLSIKFFGDARDRWAVFTSVARWLLPQGLGLKNYAGPYFDKNKNEIEIIWQIESQQDVENAVRMTRQYAEKSFTGFKGGNLPEDTKNWILEYTKQYSEEEKKELCKKELWYDLNNNITSSLFLKTACGLAYEKGGGLKALTEQIESKMKDLLLKKKYTIILQYLINLNKLLPIFNKYVLEQFDIMLSSSEYMNWSNVYFDGKNIFYYLLNGDISLPLESWGKFIDNTDKISLLSKDKNGNTILHYAVSENEERNLPVIKALIDKYPELKSIKNNEGKIPYDMDDDKDPYNKFSNNIKEILMPN